MTGNVRIVIDYLVDFVTEIRVVGQRICQTFLNLLQIKLFVLNSPFYLLTFLLNLLGLELVGIEVPFHVLKSILYGYLFATINFHNGVKNGLQVTYGLTEDTNTGKQSFIYIFKDRL